jgi:hypothetical protein
VATLIFAGSGLLIQESYGAAITFTANHNSTTTTEVKFSENINGTIRLTDWILSPTGDVRTGNITISNIHNGTPAAAADIARSLGGLGFMNDTRILLFTHEAIATGTTLTLNYTGGIQDNNVVYRGDITESHVGADGQNPADAITAAAIAVAADSNAPTADAAWTISPTKIAVQFSEQMGITNSTASDFSVVGSDVRVTDVQSSNITDVIYITLQNPIDFRGTFTLSYSGDNFITDHAVAPYNVRHFENGDARTSGFWFNGTSLENGQETGSNSGVGNKLNNFTGLHIANYIQQETDNCYDCKAPTISNLELSADASSSPIQITADNPVILGAEIGDTITVFLTLDDNKGAANIPFVGMYTNFDGDASFDNWYYTNNFDNGLQMSTSYYEWNARADNISYDLNNSITWDDPVRSVDSITGGTTFAFTLTIEDSMASSEIWIDASDNSGNYAKQQLPITLEVTGDPSLTFASSPNQKVTSFFNDTVLLTIISAFDVSSDNTLELSAALGIEEGTLPTWTTELATWAAEDKIDIADMVIAVEYVINQ